MHLWQFPTKIAEKPWLQFFTNFAIMAQKANPPKMAKPNPTKINSFRNQLLTRHFIWIFDNSPPRLLENQDFTFPPILLPRNKKQIHPTWLSQHPTKINSFCNQLLTRHFKCICDNSPPRLLENQDITFSPILLPRNKKQIHQTWLSQHPIKINSFSNQTFHTSFWCICDNSPQRLLNNPDLNFKPILQPRHTKLIHPTSLCQTQQRSIPFATKFWHLILDAFVTIPQQDSSKTMTSLFHQFCYKGTKSQSTQLG